MMNELLVNKIGTMAMESMLYEVSATPKPGLVDRNNCGAHKDMDYFTFMSSAAALHSEFDEMVQIGIRHRNEDIKKVLPDLRKCGIVAENKMFSFTNGVNTHKGMIFTLGILCGCAGWLLGKKTLTCDKLCDLAKEMCQGICESEYAGLECKENLTKGEKMYLEYGCRGVRGEVESGYQTVRQYAVPVYKKVREDGLNVNDALVQTLLHLIANTEDTNIVSRHNMKTALYARDKARTTLDFGGMLSHQGKTYVEAMDADYIRKNISPGGCADLLAVTHFLYELECSDLLKYNIIVEPMMVKLD